MDRIIKVNAGGQELDAIEADFEISREEWNQYKLLDGGTVRAKTTVSRIYRVVDEQGNQRYHQDGSPFMIVTHKTDIVANV